MSMNKHLDEVIVETERFLKKAIALRNAKLDGHLKYRVDVAEFEKRADKPSYLEPVRYHYDPSSKDTGAVRRASMDLTRALADLRRP